MPSHSPAASIVALRNVSFSFTASPEPLFAGLSVTFGQGFTGIVGANGAGKTTLLRLVCGELTPDKGSIEGSARAVMCEQRTDDPPPRLSECLTDWEGDAIRLRADLGVEPDWLERWQLLSHGERKRAQIACALWQQPEVLVLDEPTNHIDSGARALLERALSRFAGVGLLVSHDRYLLDSLCSQCLWLQPPSGEVFAGGYTDARVRRQQAHVRIARERAKLKSERKRIDREQVVRREHAAKRERSKSKRGLARNDSDGRAKANGAKNTDSGSGGRLRQLDGRRAQTEASLASISIEKTYDTGIWLPGSVSRRDVVLDLEAGSAPLGDERSLRWPRVQVRPTDRIALTGPNGAGKTTWLRIALENLNVEPGHVVSLPQEIAATEARALLASVRSLPNAELGPLMTIVSRLNSRPERLLASNTPSPGEIRKLMLALGMLRKPHVLVLDEPTNHLDLPSIEALEAALADCPCALLIVSHDERLIESIGMHRWMLSADAVGSSLRLEAF